MHAHRDDVEPDGATEVFALTRRPRTPPVSTRGDVPVPRETMLARARDALGRAVRVPLADPTAELAELDELVAVGRTREVGVRAVLLRHALAGHLAVAATGAWADDRGPDRADVLLDELLAVVAEHGLSLFGVDAQALVARRALLTDDEENALAAVSTALSHLDEPVVVDHAPTAREHRHNLCTTHRLVAGTLVSLGMHEPAQTLLDRARTLADQIGDRVGVAACDHERVRVHASWGLRLERAGRAADVQLQAAAHAAAELAAGDGGLLGADHAPLLCAATVLGRADPGPDRTDADRRAARSDLAALESCGPHHPTLHDHLVVELARARALERTGDVAAAVATLERVRAGRPRGERSLLLSVTRELSRLGDASPAPDGAAGALRAYTDELEAELWSLHQARVLSLRARVAHDRLRREHGQVAAQALSDPLTGLPNRRALDNLLGRLVGPAAPLTTGPPAVAMVDVDRFKQVNDALSHARGDEVLRLVAGALRGSLRVDDTVARYGGDEFVVVLPGTRPEDAAAALARAVRTVAALALGEAIGEHADRVTLSVGVVAARPPEDARAVLARADAVMYGVKRDGGDGVRFVEAPGAPVQTVDTAEAPEVPEVLAARPGGDLPGVRIPRGAPGPVSPAGNAGPRT